MPSDSWPADLPALVEGDILLYHPSGVFGHLIAVKTWHRVSHVEIYVGAAQSVASRDGVGVGQYPLRLAQLAFALRPRVPLNWTAGLAYFESMKGQPYGWWDLFEFVGAPVNRKGIVCSPFAAGLLRACGWPVFPTDPIEKVAPFQFLDLIEPGVCDLVYDADHPAPLLAPRLPSDCGDPS